MANSAFLRSLISNPTKINTNFVLKPSLNLISRPFSSSESNPNSDPPISPDSFTQITTTVDPFCIAPGPVNQNKLKDFFKARTDGLFVTAASKVFDRMSKRLRPFHNNRKFTHEATDRSKGHGHARMPDVVAHIAVLEAYANAGQTHTDAYKVYLKMLGPGGIPNEVTYNMLVKLLASTSSGDYKMIGQAQKYLIEMLEKGIRPDAPTSVALFKALAKEGRVREGQEFLQDLKARGFVVDDRLFKEVLKGRGSPIKVLQSKRGRVIKTVLEILFDKKSMRAMS